MLVFSILILNFCEQIKTIAIKLTFFEKKRKEGMQTTKQQNYNLSVLIN